MSVESKVQSLIDSVNTITGESREDLTSGIQDLADKYGKSYDGRFYPMDVIEYIIPKMTLIYNGSEI